MTDDYRVNSYHWIFSRRREGGRFDYGVSGFASPLPGATGEISILLPSPFAPRTTLDPVILEIRDLALASLKSERRGVVTIDKDTLTAYAVALLRMNYRLSDLELTTMLAGSGWHAAMVDHVTANSTIGRCVAITTPQATPPELAATRKLVDRVRLQLQGN